MKKLLKILFLIFFSFNLYASNGNVNYFNKLISNGYINIAIEYGKKYQNNKQIKKRLLELLLYNGEYNEIIKLYNNSNNISELIYVAKSYIYLKKFDKANIYLKKIKKLNSSIYAELSNLYSGVIFYDKYNYEKAIKYFEKIKNKSDKTKYFLVKLYIFSNRLNDAKKTLNSMGSKDLFLHALIFYKEHKYQNAVKILKNMQKNNENLTLLYNCYLKSRQLNLAENVLKSLKLTNNSFYKNIETLINYGKFDDAIARLVKAPDSYYKNYYIGEINFLKKYYNNAVQYYEKAIKFEKNSKIFYKIATAYFENNQFINAVKYFEKVISRQDSDFYYVNSLYKAGISYYKIGNFTLSEKYLLLYLRNNNGALKYVLETLHILGDIYERKGNLLKCIDILNKIEDVTDNKVEIKKIDLKIAELWNRLGKYNFAANVYKKYYPVKNKEDIFILEKLGDIYNRAGDFKGSNLFYLEYIDKIDKFKANIFLKIALNYLYQDNFNEAKSYLLEIINNESTGSFKEEALYYLGKINFQLKNYKSAIIYFNRLYLINKFSPLSEKAVKYIAYSSYILNDKSNFSKFFKVIKNKYNFIKEFNIPLQKIYSFVNRKESLIIELNDEKNFNYFTNIYRELKGKSSDEIYTFINENTFIANKVIIYYYAGKIFKNRGLDNKANFAFNKFLNNGFISKYYFEYKEILPEMLLFYFTKKDYQKILNYFPIFSHIENLSETANFIIGYSAYKLRLDEMAKKYLSNFIEISQQGEKIFRASFILDKLNFLDLAAKGYKKSISLLKNEKIKIEALYWLGEIYRKKKKYFDAINYYLQIKLLYPFDLKWTPTASFQVAKIFEIIGEKKRALKEYSFIYNHLKDDDARKEFVKNRINILKGENLE